MRHKFELLVNLQGTVDNQHFVKKQQNLLDGWRRNETKSQRMLVDNEERFDPNKGRRHFQSIRKRVRSQSGKIEIIYF